MCQNADFQKSELSIGSQWAMQTFAATGLNNPSASVSAFVSLSRITNQGRALTSIVLQVSKAFETSHSEEI